MFSKGQLNSVVHRAAMDELLKKNVTSCPLLLDMSAPDVCGGACTEEHLRSCHGLKSIDDLAPRGDSRMYEGAICAAASPIFTLTGTHEVLPDCFGQPIILSGVLAKADDLTKSPMYRFAHVHGPKDNFFPGLRTHAEYVKHLRAGAPAGTQLPKMGSATCKFPAAGEAKIAFREMESDLLGHCEPGKEVGFADCVKALGQVAADARMFSCCCDSRWPTSTTNLLGVPAELNGLGIRPVRRIAVEVTVSPHHHVVYKIYQVLRSLDFATWMTGTLPEDFFIGLVFNDTQASFAEGCTEVKKFFTWLAQTTFPEGSAPLRLRKVFQERPLVCFHLPHANPFVATRELQTHMSSIDNSLKALAVVVLCCVGVVLFVGRPLPHSIGASR